MTSAEKQRIIRLREQGLGYAQIANRMGLSKSTVSTFCKRNGLAEENKEPAKPCNYLLFEGSRGKTDADLPQPTTVVSNAEVPENPCQVTVSYAEKPAVFDCSKISPVRLQGLNFVDKSWITWYNFDRFSR